MLNIKENSKTIINLFCITICSSVVIALFVGDMLWLSNMVKTGLLEFPHPEPYYGFMILNKTKSNPNSDGALGADFAQVYFAAKAIKHGDSPYNPKQNEFKDQFDRLPNYPPLTNHLYIPLTYLPYHQALLVHNFGTIILFLGFSGFILHQTKLLHYFWKILTMDLLLFFYTSLGVSHFERGQFDFFVGASFLAIFTLFFTTKRGLLFVILSGFFAAIKWSSAPFLGTLALFGFLGTNSKKRWLYILIILIPPASALLFFSELLEYYPSLALYEFNAEPAGVSFSYFFSRQMSKSIQILCALFIFFIYWKNSKTYYSLRLFQAMSFPFAMAMAIQGMCYGTMSFEYRVVSLLGLIPAFVIWTEKTIDVSQKIKMFSGVFFAFFLIISYRVFDFSTWSEPYFNSKNMSLFYIVNSFLWIGLCVYIIRRFSHLAMKASKI